MWLLSNNPDRTFLGGRRETRDKLFMLLVVFQ
jgi:hypothetical protein